MSFRPKMTLTSRRRFLQSIGAATLAMPILPSIVNPAFAQSADPYKRIVFLTWSHGVAAPLWRPTFAGDYVERMIGHGETIRERRMADATHNLYLKDHIEHLHEKITMISGVTQLGATGHSPPVALTASQKGEREKSIAPDSIDNIIASSTSLYPSAPKLDVLRLTTSREVRRSMSFLNNNPVKTLPQSAAFEQLFGDGFGEDMGAEPSGPSPEVLRARRKKLIVDKSLARYDKLLKSGRLSTQDRQILEQSMEGIFELQANLQSRIDNTSDLPVTDACQAFGVSDLDENEAIAQDNINLITQAFACNHTRVAIWGLPSSHNDESGAHHAYNNANKDGHGIYSTLIRRNCKWIGQLLDKMDGITEGNGKTMLDNSLVMVTSDMSTSTIGSHPGLDAPYLFAGGLGGLFKMGLHLDYHDWSAQGNLEGRAKFLKGKKERLGMHLQGGPPHNELLISIMKGFNLTASEWERDGLPGFGRYSCGDDPLCDPDKKEQSVQMAYATYYDEIYANRSWNSPGKELPYFRQGAS